MFPPIPLGMQKKLEKCKKSYIFIRKNHVFLTFKNVKNLKIILENLRKKKHIKQDFSNF